MTLFATTQDPFAPFDAAKKHPITPEPATYGLVLMLLVGALVMWRRMRR